MKNNLKQISSEKFSTVLTAYRQNRAEGFSGPFIHSAPAGSMFRGPFEERTWMVGPETVLIKRRTGAGDREYFAPA